MEFDDAAWAAIRAVIRYGLRALERPVTPFLPFDPDRLVRTAKRRAGVHEFEDELFREGLEVLLGSLENEARLNLLGRIVAREDVVRLLATRLRLEEDRRRDPGIAIAEIHRPIFITGLPRSGSTLLQRLLAHDHTNRVAETWEMMDPCPPPARQSYDTDPRIGRAERDLLWFKRLTPTFPTVHDVGARLPEECVMIIAHSFLSSQFTSMYTVPSYERWCDAQDRTVGYRVHKRFLQHLQRRCRAERWVLKAPAHFTALPALFGVYPDARIVVMHREPLEVLGSQANLLYTLRRTFSERIDPHEIGREAARVLAEDITLGVRGRACGCAPPERYVDVVYDEILADPIAVVRRIYRQFNLALTKETLARMRRYLMESPRHRHGVHEYSLTQFGLDHATEHARHESYRERFLHDSNRDGEVA